MVEDSWNKRLTFSCLIIFISAVILALTEKSFADLPSHITGEGRLSTYSSDDQKTKAIEHCNWLNEIKNRILNDKHMPPPYGIRSCVAPVDIRFATEFECKTFLEGPDGPDGKAGPLVEQAKQDARDNLLLLVNLWKLYCKQNYKCLSLKKYVEHAPQQQCGFWGGAFWTTLFNYASAEYEEAACIECVREF